MFEIFFFAIFFGQYIDFLVRVLTGVLMRFVYKICSG